MLIDSSNGIQAPATGDAWISDPNTDVENVIESRDTNRMTNQHKLTDKRAARFIQNDARGYEPMVNKYINIEVNNGEMNVPNELGV